MKIKRKALKRINQAVADGEPLSILEYLDVDVRTIDVLEAKGYHTVESVLMASTDTLRDTVKCIGPVAIDSLLGAFSRFDEIDERIRQAEEAGQDMIADGKAQVQRNRELLLCSSP